jgi:SAM-dependent methyltransferase
MKFARRHLEKVKEIIVPIDLRIRPVIKEVDNPRVNWIRENSFGKILDVGSADGLIYEGMNEKVIFFDIDVYKIKNFVRGDAHYLPFKDNCFDTVNVSELLEHVEDPLLVLKEAKRVSRNIIIATVPNEYIWSKDKAPLITREERMVKDGKISIKQMAYDFVGVNPACKEIYDEEKYPHLWHRNWFKREDIEKLLNNLNSEYEIKEISYNGYGHFLIKVKI